MAYLFYLPFCMVFTSNDKLHAATVPLFLRSNQSFVPGLDLKKGLAFLDEHFSELPSEVKRKGLHHFASHPPFDNSFLVTQLWDRHMRSDWREILSSGDRKTGSTFEKELIEKIKRSAEAPTVVHKSSDGNSDKLDYLITEHYVVKRKGKWKRFPPEIDK